MPNPAELKTPAQLGDERVHQGGEAGWASAVAIVHVRVSAPVKSLTIEDWPVSGDDLTLVKAGVIA